jgi:hypothetical protein
VILSFEAVGRLSLLKRSVARSRKLPPGLRAREGEGKRMANADTIDNSLNVSDLLRLAETNPSGCLRDRPYRNYRVHWDTNQELWPISPNFGPALGYFRTFNAECQSDRPNHASG